jgi:hypothetical protein
VQERADLLGREAEEDRRTAAAESARTLEAARAEAAALVSSAKEQAERIRRDSERELAAATARRDSITAQLSNVRQMLSTLGGAAMAESLVGEEAAPQAEQATPPAEAPAQQQPADPAAHQQQTEQQQTEQERSGKQETAEQAPADKEASDRQETAGQEASGKQSKQPKQGARPGR